MKHQLVSLQKIVLPLGLCAAILWWMYRDFDFASVGHVLAHEMDWTWMILSLPFGILAEALRGWRWRQTLEPVGEKPRYDSCLNAVFLSYALSLVVPRVGEFARCGVLSKWEGCSFSKALGTVVVERAIDMLLMAVIAGITLLCCLRKFSIFFAQTGTNFDTFLRGFTTTGYIVSAICLVAMGLLAYFLLRRLAIYGKVKTVLGSVWEGICSLRKVKHRWLFTLMTLGIWGSYFLHYYFTFFCFPFTSGLGLECALVTFTVGSIAVIVPTPNGAGPWHFAVKTMLVLYGVAEPSALAFVLLVHGIQTLLVALLGPYAWLRLNFSKKKPHNFTI